MLFNHCSNLPNRPSIPDSPEPKKKKSSSTRCVTRRGRSGCGPRNKGERSESDSEVTQLKAQHQQRPFLAKKKKRKREELCP